MPADADVAVITACYGRFDVLRAPVPQDVAVDWICVTDDPTLEPPAPWRVLPAKATHSHPRLSAKRPKLQPWHYTDHPHVIWIDASMEVTDPGFVRGALAARRDGIAAWRHPHRDCIYAEAVASLLLVPAKYGHLPIIAQVWSYYLAGYPPGAGLFGCGTLAWDAQDVRARLLGEAWMDECHRWTYQDQLSLPVVARRLGVEVGTFPHPLVDRAGHGERGRVLANPWLRIHPHEHQH